MALYDNKNELSDEELKEASGGFLYPPEGSCQT